MCVASLRGRADRRAATRGDVGHPEGRRHPYNQRPLASVRPGHCCRPWHHLFLRERRPHRLYRLIQDARDLDLIVTPNLFGDVLADLGAVLLGSRGLSFSGNFSATGAAVYQTNHGAGYDLAGTDQANPVGQILSLAMLLRESFAMTRGRDFDRSRCLSCLAPGLADRGPLSDFFSRDRNAGNGRAGSRRGAHPLRRRAAP